MNQPQQEKCAYCSEKLKRLTKHLKDGTKTNSKTYVCTNPNCCLSVSISKIKTWNDK